jgi:hypothetical protein
MVIEKIDNFLHKEYQNYLQKLVELRELPVYFAKDTVTPGEYGTKQDKNSMSLPQFTHVFVQDSIQSSVLCDVIKPITYGLLATNGFGANKNLSRCKLNLNPILPDCSNDKYFIPHMDSGSTTAISGIYYINDADGDTLFFDDNENIVERVTPKQGLFILFNSNIFHAGQPPKTTSYRALINFVWD